MFEQREKLFGGATEEASLSDKTLASWASRLLDSAYHGRTGQTWDTEYLSWKKSYDKLASKARS